MSQREQLKWAESLPLFGKRILVTRSRSQASELVRGIEELGGEPYEFPVIDIVMPEGRELADTDEALAQLERYDWVFFTSVNGVEYFFSHLERLGKDVRGLHKARIAAVGPATQAALRQRGIAAEGLPGKFQAEGLMDTYGSELQPGQHVLLPRGDLARAWLPAALREQGLTVTDAVMYRTVPAGEADDELLKMLEKGRIHAVTFTSSSTVTNLLAALSAMGVADPAAALRGTEIACIGPVTANTAKEAGLNVSILAEEATIDSLLQSLCAWKERSAPAE
ncbi:uroporphyrinogen-III synthase [compost metagenome]